MFELRSDGAADGDAPPVQSRRTAAASLAPPKSAIRRKQASGQSAAAVPQKLGRFEIQSVLGAGAFGTVYRARDPVLNREVALKVPHVPKVAPSATGSDKQDDSAARFLREAQAAAQLTHPNIVPIYDVGLADGQPFIASKYIAGQTLDAAIEAGGIDIKQAAEIVRQLADALAYAHDAGVIHRDIKPANIMLDKNGQPHLMDFGLARLADEREKLTHDGSLLGTPAYMSPEQAGGESTVKVSSQSDQYSLGVVLYELLSGQRPFEGPVEVVIFNVLKVEPPSPRSIKPSIPRDLETVCQKATAKEAAARYGDCREFAKDLQRWQSDEPIQARRVGRAERFVRWCRRNPIVAASTAAVGVLLLLIAVISSWAYRSTSTSLARAEQQRQFAEQQQHVAEQERLRATEHQVRSSTSEYTTKIRTVQLLIENRDYSAARNMLNECASNMRGWEYGFLWKQIHRERATLKESTGQVSSVAFSPDSRWIVSGSALSQEKPGEIRLWNAVTGQQIRTFTGHGGLVRSVSFSPDGLRIVASGYDRIVKIWDVATGRIVLTLRENDRDVNSAAFSPDGQRIVTSTSSGSVRIWDTATGDELSEFKARGRVCCVAYGPKNRPWIAAGCTGRLVQIWDVDTGKEVQSFQDPLVRHRDNDVRALAFSPNGEWIVTVSGDESPEEFGPRGRNYFPTLKIWSLQTSQLMMILKGHTDDIYGVAVSPDGRRIASASKDKTIRVWDVATGKETMVLEGHRGKVHGVAFSPNGRRLVSGGGIGMPGFPDGGIEIKGEIKIWDVGEDGDLVHIEGGSPGTAAASPDGRTFVGSSPRSSVTMWNSSGKAVRSPVNLNLEVSCLAYSNDSSHCIAGGKKGTLVIWNATTGRKILVTKQHDTNVVSATFFPDDRKVVSAADHGTIDDQVKIWDAKSGELIRSLSVVGFDGSGCTAVSSDGRYVACGGSGRTVRIWNSATGEEIQTLGEPADNRSSNYATYVTCVVFSSDGRLIVTGGGQYQNYGEINVWEVETGQRTMSIKTASNWIERVAISLDGRRVFSNAVETTAIKIWDVSTGQEVLELKGSKGHVRSLTLSSDGTRLVSVENNVIVRTWDASM